jgi:hypothetical protein
MWIIGFNSADVSVQTLAYTVPSAKELLATVEFCNRGTAAATVSYWVVPSAESVGNQHIKESTLTLTPAGQASHVLARTARCPAGAKIYVQASNANVSCQVSGDETAQT